MPGRHKPNPNSRSARWERAVGDARSAYDAMNEQKNELESALSVLDDLKGEYQDWLDNLPDSLRQSPVGEKLEAITNLDIPTEVTDLDEADTAITEAEGADLPLGWGRD